MNIADELMEYANKFKNSHDAWSGISDDLTAIADRINMEHERRMVERADLYSELRAKMNNCYIELPKDADGEYIHIGDVMEWVPYDNTCSTVVRKVVAVGTDVFFAWSVEKQGYAQYEACAYHHFYTPTVEDVLLEACKAYHGLMIEGISDFAHDMPAPSEIIAKYAAKLRLAEKRETYE